MVLETYLYDVLMVSVTATPEEISKSYKRLALKYHPDKTNHDPALTDKFKAVTNAYEILRDRELRLIYDTHGQSGLDSAALAAEQHHGHTPPATTQIPSNANRYGYNAPNIYEPFIIDSGPLYDEDVPFLNPFGHSGYPNYHDHSYSYKEMPYSMNETYHQNFGDKYPGGPAPQSHEGITKKRGADIHHTFQVTLADMYFGKTVKFLLPRMKTCTNCDGQGCKHPETCLRCEGSGRIILTIEKATLNARLSDSIVCEECKGRGIAFDPYDICDQCDDGYVIKKESVKVYILPGSKHGDRFVLEGKGDEGRDIVPGDVVICLEEIPHAFLVRKGDDLYFERDIDLKMAMTGGRIIISNYLKEGEDLAVFLNVHGEKPLNDSLHPCIDKGEIVGPIDSKSPKVVKGLGMPINPSMKNGLHVQTCKHFTMKDNSSLLRGDLCITFKVLTPSLKDFADPATFAKIISLLPGTIMENPTGRVYANKSLSNMPPEPEGYESTVASPDMPVHLTDAKSGFHGHENGGRKNSSVISGLDKSPSGQSRSKRHRICSDI